MKTMKTIITIFIAITFLSCGKKSRTDNLKNSEPIVIKHAEIGELNIEKIKGGIKGLETTLKTYFLNRLVLNSEMNNIIVNSFSFNKFKNSFTIDYDWQHEEINWDTDEKEILNDNCNVLINMENVYFDHTNLSFRATITKHYTEQNIDYYGENYNIKNTDISSENISINLNEIKTNLNKVSAMYIATVARRIKRDELINFSKDELGYLRNEFYARKGYIFKTAKMKNYFSKNDWYIGTQNSLEGLLSDNELKNIFFIKAMEAEIILEKNSKNNFSNIWEKGVNNKLRNIDLNNLNSHELYYLRNEFYARHGYIFVSERLNKYFSAQPWYSGKSKNVNNKITNIEKYNIELIRNLEKQMK